MTSSSTWKEHFAWPRGPLLDLAVTKGSLTLKSGALAVRLLNEESDREEEDGDGKDDCTLVEDSEAEQVSDHRSRKRRQVQHIEQDPSLHCFSVSATPAHAKVQH